MCLIVALQLASPLADSNPHAGGVIALVVLLSLLTGATYMADRKVVRLVVTPIAGLWVVARAFEALGPDHHIYSHLAPIAGLALSCSLLWAILIRFDSLPLVTADVISEAFISYMIIAIAFSQLYWILDRLVDNAFSQPISPTDSSILLYFSMITITTVGYGRIAPLNPYVRLVAGFEGMIGVFYIAVVVSRLISSYYPRARRGELRHPADPPAQ